MHTWALEKVASLFILESLLLCLSPALAAVVDMCLLSVALELTLVLYWLLSKCHDKTQWYKAPHIRKFILADRSKGIRFHHGGGKACLMAGAKLIYSNTSRKHRRWTGKWWEDLNSQSLPPATYSSSNGVPSKSSWTVAPAGDQAFKCLSLWRTLSFKPPEMHSLSPLAQHWTIPSQIINMRLVCNRGEPSASLPYPKEGSLCISSYKMFNFTRTLRSIKLQCQRTPHMAWRCCCCNSFSSALLIKF